MSTVHIFFIETLPTVMSHIEALKLKATTHGKKKEMRWIKHICGPVKALTSLIFTSLFEQISFGSSSDFNWDQ